MNSGHNLRGVRRTGHSAFWRWRGPCSPSCSLKAVACGAAGFCYGSHPASAYMPSWWIPLMVVWFISAQVALAAGWLALLRAWRLRHKPVITAADAAILNRRAALHWPPEPSRCHPPGH